MELEDEKLMGAIHNHAQAITALLSRRTAEPQPAEPSNELIQLRELMRQLVDIDRSIDPETGEDTTLERVKYLCQTLVPDATYPPPSVCGVCGKELVFTVGPHNEGDTLITSDCRHSFRSNRKPAEPSPAPIVDVIELVAQIIRENRGGVGNNRAMAHEIVKIIRTELLANPPQEWLDKRDAEWDAALRQIGEREHASMLGKKIGYDARAILGAPRLTPKTAEHVPVECVAKILKRACPKYAWDYMNYAVVREIIAAVKEVSDDN